MARYFCHEHPDVLSLETRVVDARPGAVVLEQTPFYPGGGGQLADHGTLRWDRRRGRRHLFRARRRRALLASAGPAGGASRRGGGGGRTCVPHDDDRAAHRHTHPQRARLPAVRPRAGHRRAAERRPHGADGLRPARCRQRQAARAGGRAQRSHPPGPAAALHLRPAGRGHHRSTVYPQPLGGPAAGRRRADPHRGDRGPRSSGVRRHASGLDRALAPAADLSRSTTRAATTAACGSVWRADPPRLQRAGDAGASHGMATW